MTSKERTFLFYLAPRFSMMSLMSMTEPLRAANEIARHTLYKCRYISQTGSVYAVNGMSVVVEKDLPYTPGHDAIIVCASYDPQAAMSLQVSKWLRWHDAHGTTLGAADTGAFILADAGLLHGHRVTLHWMSLDAFRERYPQIEVTSNLFELSALRYTCAGATAGMDFMLEIIKRHHGAFFASQVANQFIRGPIRIEEYQTASGAVRFGTRDKVVNAVVQQMEANCENPVPIHHLANRAGISLRRLQRLFKLHLQSTPVRFYQKCRLRHARRLLHQTSLQVGEIALASGFASRTQFSRAYKTTFGHAPAHERKH